MTWRIEFEQAAAKEFRKLEPRARRRIRTCLESRVRVRDDPRELGKPLRGRLASLWRYRVGDYRIVCDLRDAEFVILVVRVGHRREIYD